MDVNIKQVDNILTGSLPIEIKTNSVPFPESWFLNWQIITSQSSAQALPADLSSYGAGFVTISGLTIETINMQALVDGTVVSNPILVKSTAGVYSAASALGNGTFYFPICFKSARITKSAAAETVTATFAFKTSMGFV